MLKEKEEKISKIEVKAQDASYYNFSDKIFSRTL